MERNRRLASLIAIAGLLLTPLAPAFAASPFDANFVMADSDVTDTHVPDGFAQKFLEAHGSGIAKMTFIDPLDGISQRKPGDIITEAAKIYGVNPKFLLALIQKEQSLVDDPSPSPCQIDWAAGYGRPDGSTCGSGDARYRGFTAQVVNAAAYARYFYDKDLSGDRRSFGFFSGQPASIDGRMVVPANIATAMLYSYNPHLHGNTLLSSIWARWFVPLYPDGSYLTDGTKTYLIQGGMKRTFATKSALMSRVDPSRVMRVGADVLATYQDGPDIKFSEWSLLRVPKGTVYLISKDTKRPIVSMAVFRALGFNPDEVDNVDPADLASYPDGDPVTLKSAYPIGALLQDKKTGGVFYVESSVKHPILSAEIMKADYPDKKISAVATSVLNKYQTGDPLKFPDGELVTSPGSNATVFIISNGQRRPFASGQAFESLGYDWSRVVTTSDKALALHPLGQPLDAAATGTLQIAAD